MWPVPTVLDSLLNSRLISVIYSSQDELQATLMGDYRLLFDV